MQNLELTRQLAHAEERLASADAGSLFDLKKDSIAAIARVICETVSAGRARSIVDAIRQRAKEN